MSEAVSEPGLSDHTTDPKEYDFSYEEVQQMVDAIDSWVFLKNRDGEYILNNEKHAEESKGMSPDELRGMSNFDFVDADVEDAAGIAEDVADQIGEVARANDDIADRVNELEQSASQLTERQ